MKTLLCLSLALAFGSIAHASQPLQLLPAATGDQIVQQLSQAKSEARADLEREPVDFAWPLDPDAPLFETPPFKAESREFWTRLSAAELHSGHRFQTTAAVALIRLSPGTPQAKRTALNLDTLQLRHNGQTLDMHQAVRVAADAEQMKAAGVDFGEGSLVFQLAPHIGPGLIELAAPQAEGEWLLHVHEPDSRFRLELGADRSHLLSGETLVLNATLHDGDQRRSAQRIGGLVTAPDGRSVEIDFSPDGLGGYQARFQVPDSASPMPGLWEVHTFASHHDGKAQTALLRDAKTSFALAEPTARLRNQARIGYDKSGAMSLDLALDVASPGRYELRGVLYGSTAQGTLKPFAIAHSARWLDVGEGHIRLNFSPELMTGSGLAAPFELRDLRLNDQSRHGHLETRARALRIEN